MKPECGAGRQLCKILVGYSTQNISPERPVQVCQGPGHVNATNRSSGDVVAVMRGTPSNGVSTTESGRMKPETHDAFDFTGPSIVKDDGNRELRIRIDDIVYFHMDQTSKLIILRH